MTLPVARSVLGTSEVAGWFCRRCSFAFDQYVDMSSVQTAVNSTCCCCGCVSTGFFYSVPAIAVEVYQAVLEAG